MASEPNTPTILKAAGAVSSLLPHAASAAVGISLVAYYAGWRDANAYYTVIGSPWAVSLLPTTKLLYLSAELVLAIFLCAFFSVHALATDMVKLKGLGRFSIGAFILSMVLALVTRWLPADIGTPKVAWILANCSGICFAAAAGTTLGEVAARLSENKLEWTISHVFLIYIAVFVGFYSAPSMMGSARARYHLDSFITTLPVAHLIPDGQSQNWRVIEAMGESTLLMDRPAGTTRSLFRIVKTTDILWIDGIPTETGK